MNINDVNGVGKATSKKLIDNGITSIQELANTTEEELEKINIQNSARIINNAKKMTSEVYYDINDSNKYLIHAFKKSHYYDEDQINQSYHEWYNALLKLYNKE